jgi:hypothetical protein
MFQLAMGCAVMPSLGLIVITISTALIRPMVRSGALAVVAALDWASGSFPLDVKEAVEEKPLR